MRTTFEEKGVKLVLEGGGVFELARPSVLEVWLGEEKLVFYREEMISLFECIRELEDSLGRQNEVFEELEKAIEDGEI